MKKQLFLCWLWATALSCHAQPVKTEFGISENGLIYGDTTIRQLKFIVDSLNLKFKVCELNKPYLAMPQARAHYIFIEKSAALNARKDIDSSISFSDFLKKYPSCKVEKDLLVIKSGYKKEDKQVTSFNSVELNGKYDHEIEMTDHPAQFQAPVNGKWVYTYNTKSEYSDQSIEAFYFVTDFVQPALPEKYARMVQYSDCLIDTTTQIFFETARRNRWRVMEDSSKVIAFLNYVDKETGDEPVYNEKEYDEKKYDQFIAAHKQWTRRRESFVKNTLSKRPAFTTRLAEAVEETTKKGSSCDAFEEYVETYISKKLSLELKRNRVVVGGCSQDQAPRIHALNIARLSAETVNWETFLRAHLDIMNDRFNRVSDGSYAWKDRKTYIKEHEVLDINVPDLMLGISLRVKNASTNHYFGSLQRLGRALSETKDPTGMEEKMLAMVADKELDSYNRILIYYLFLHYAYNIEDLEKRKWHINKLNETVKTFPDFLATRAVFTPKGK